MTQHAPSRRASRGCLKALTQLAPSQVPFDPTCSVFFAQFGTIFDHKYDISTIQADDQSLRFPDPTCSVVSSHSPPPLNRGGVRGGVIARPGMPITRPYLAASVPLPSGERDLPLHPLPGRGTAARLWALCLGHCRPGGGDDATTAALERRLLSDVTGVELSRSCAGPVP